jgi:hypothetical protein
MHYGGFAELAAAVCCALSERNRGNKQHSEAKARFSKRGSTSSRRASTNQLTSLLARARFSSALDKSKMGSSAQALYQTLNVRRLGKTQWHNAGLIKFANLQIAIFRRELDRGCCSHGRVTTSGS